jgi:uncharacterized membrane protein
MKVSSIVFLIMLLLIMVGSHYHYSTKDRTQPKYRLIMAFVIYPSIWMFVVFILLKVMGE